MDKLKHYLEKTGKPQKAFADEVGTTPGHISALKTGLRKPSIDLAAAIERATGGAVPASSWASQPPGGAA